MKDPIKLIKLGLKTGFTALVVSTMVFGGLFLNLRTASATPAPNMTINHLVTGPSSSSWSDSVTLNPGDVVHFYAGIHNTVVGSTANGVVISATVPSGTFTDGTSTAQVRVSNANTASDNVSIHINGGGSLEIVPGTTRITWDVDGDGNKEYNNTFIAGSPLEGSGILLGDQHGCNEFIIQVGWSAKVVGGTQPSPTPTPTPQPSPTPPACTDCGGDENNNNNDNNNENNNNNNQDQEQNQDVDVNVSQSNNQTVNITSPAPPAVAGVKVPLKQPETGVSVLGTSLMAGAAPVGYALSRFGRGRIVSKKEEETLGEFANGIVSGRGKRSDA